MYRVQLQQPLIDDAQFFLGYENRRLVENANSKNIVFSLCGTVVEKKMVGALSECDFY